MRTRYLAPIAFALALAPTGLAQDAPKEPAPPPEQPAATWPKYVKKELHAKDIRGKKAPEFVVEEMLTEKPNREGKVVIIDFWATWCPPCRKTIPELNDLQKKFKADVVVIGISDEEPSKVRNFMEKTEVRYTQAIDTQSRMSGEIEVAGIPHVLVISTDGIVRWQGNPLDPSDRLSEKLVKQVVDADPGVKARREKEAKNSGG